MTNSQNGDDPPVEGSGEKSSSTAQPGFLSVQFARIIGMIVAPRRILPRVTYGAEAWVPVIVVALALAVIRLTMISDVREEYSSDEFRKWYAEQKGISETEASEDLRTLSRSAPIMAFVEAPIVVTGSVAATTLVLFLIGKFGFGGGVGFRVVFGMVAWSGIVSVIPLVLSLPLKLINSSWMIPTSPAWFMPESMHSNYSYGFLSLLDVFVIWEAWLLAIGMAFLYDIPFQRAVTVVGTMVICFAALNGIAVAIGNL